MSVRILIGDCRERLLELADGSVHCAVCSPPYFGLRDYGVAGQMGRERTPEEYVAAMVAVFREVRRVLREDGTLWLNVGDSYAGSWGNYGGRNRGAGSQRPIARGSQLQHRGSEGLEDERPAASRKMEGFKRKDRMMIPARLALALQADGWWLRDEIVWHKPRTAPAPLKDRTVPAHEMIYMFAKAERYHYDYLAIEEPSAYPGLVRKGGKAFRRLKAQDPNAARKRISDDRQIVVRDTRRKRSVWSVVPQPYTDAHFATYPPALIEPCIRAGCPEGGTVLDPFFGAGTTGVVAERLGRSCVGIELNAAYAELAMRRIQKEGEGLAEVELVHAGPTTRDAA